MAQKSLPQSFSPAAFLKRAESVYRRVENKGPERERVELEIRTALKLEGTEDPKRLAPEHGSPLDLCLHSLNITRLNFTEYGGLTRGDELHGLCLLAGLAARLEGILAAAAAGLDRLEGKGARK